jgi:outer membrane protein OmpA-like peptidoglycan-associated protein
MKNTKQNYSKHFFAKTAGAITTFLFGAASLANVVGSDVQNFNPTTNGLDFITVHSSKTLDPGIVNFGFFLNYSVNTMPNYEDVTTQSRTDFEDSMLGSDINIGMGLLKNWDIGLGIQQIVTHTSEDNNNVYSGEIVDNGLADIRVNTKVRVLGDETWGIAGIVSANFDQVQNNPYTGFEPGPTLNFEIAFDTTFSSGISWGVNAGYRVRNSGEQFIDVPIEPYGDQYLLSTALSFRFDQIDTKWINEIYGSFPTETPLTTSDRDVSSLEFLTGFKTDITHSVSVHYGAGTEIYQGSSSPDWRVYAGINVDFGPLWGQPGTVEEAVEKQITIVRPIPAPETERIVMGDVLFELDKTEIRESFRIALLDFAKYMRESGYKTILVEGHTDSVGSAAYNQDLSERRANAVRAFLIQSANLDGRKIRARGYGESRPVESNNNYQGRKKNRRVEFKITRDR